MIRRASDSDCNNLAALSLEVWLQTYSVDGIRTENSKYALSTFTEEYFKQRLRDSKYRLIVFEEGIYIRGYVLVNLESQFQNEANGFEIEKLYVHPPFQGHGIGRKLLLEIKAQFGDRFWLYTWVRNKSVSFYQKFGFKNIGLHSFRFGDDTIENYVLGYDGS